MSNLPLLLSTGVGTKVKKHVPVAYYDVLNHAQARVEKINLRACDMHAINKLMISVAVLRGGGAGGAPPTQMSGPHCPPPQMKLLRSLVWQVLLLFIYYATEAALFFEIY